MAFTTPLTWVGTTPISVANLNTYLRDNQAFLHNPPMCKISSASTHQSLSSGSEATIAFDASTTEWYDTDGMWTSPNDYLVVKTAGVYGVTAMLGFWLNATGERELRIFDDTTAIASTGPIAGTATSGPAALQVLSVYTEHYFSVNDQISMKGWQDSGGGLNAGGNFMTSLAASWIGAGT